MKYSATICRGRVILDTKAGTITGDTYRAKEDIKQDFRGAKWDSAKHAWVVDPQVMVETIERLHHHFFDVCGMKVIEEDAPGTSEIVEAEQPAEVKAEVKAEQPTEAKAEELAETPKAEVSNEDKADTASVNIHTFSWVTPRDAQVEADIVVEHIIHKTLDGIEYKCDEWYRYCTGVRLNGKTTRQHDLTEWGVKHPSIRIDQRGRDKVYVELPADVIEAVYGEERAAARAANERAERLDRWYDERNAQLRAAMDNE